MIVDRLGAAVDAVIKDVSHEPKRAER
jgi:hypothetical protein